MSNNVDITMAANAKEVDRALDRMSQGLDKANAKIEKMKVGGKQSAQSTATAFQRAGSAIGNAARDLVSTFVGVSGVASGIMKAVEVWRHEIEKGRKIQLAARAESITFGEAVRDTRAAFGADKTLGEGDLEQAILGISERTNALPQKIAIALQTAFSAKGSLSNQAALDAVEQAFRLNPQNTEQATTLAGRFLDVAQAGGVEDIRSSAGFIQNIQAASRITTSEKVGQNIIPAIKSITAFGDSLEEAGELLVTLNRLLVDEQGRITATAGISLAGQLANFVPERDEKSGKFLSKDARGEFEIPESQVKAFQQAINTTQRVESLSKSEELRRAFIAQASFQVKTREQSIALLRATDEATRQFADVKKSIRGIGTAEEKQFQAKLFEEEIETQRQGQFQPIVTAKEGAERVEAVAALKDMAGQRRASAREIFEETIGKLDLPGVDYTKEYRLKRSLRLRENKIGEHFALEQPEDPAIVTLRDLLPKESDPQSRKIGNRFSRFAKDSDGAKKVAEMLKVLELQRAEGMEAEERARMSAAQEQFRSVRSQLGTAPGFSGPVSPEAPGTTFVDPQMEENNQLLRRIAEGIDRSTNTRPIDRPTARLSRGSNN